MIEGCCIEEINWLHAFLRSDVDVLRYPFSELLYRLSWEEFFRPVMMADVLETPEGLFPAKVAR